MGITIKTAVRFILNNEKIHNKKQLERWCKDNPKSYIIMLNLYAKIIGTNY